MIKTDKILGGGDFESIVSIRRTLKTHYTGLSDNHVHYNSL